MSYRKQIYQETNLTHSVKSTRSSSLERKNSITSMVSGLVNPYILIIFRQTQFISDDLNMSNCSFRYQNVNQKLKMWRLVVRNRIKPVLAGIASTETWLQPNRASSGPRSVYSRWVLSQMKPNITCGVLAFTTNLFRFARNASTFPLLSLKTSSPFSGSGIYLNLRKKNFHTAFWLTF